MKKIHLLGIVLLIMTSCSEESTPSTEDTNQISGYKITDYQNYDDPTLDDYKRIITGTLVNGKMHTLSTESFLNNISQGNLTTQQVYFYTNDLLTEINRSSGLIDNYFYDSLDRFVGATRVFPSGSVLHYRFVYPNESTVYCERLNLPYSDPAANIIRRMILIFDGDDNVISAGYDNDLDGLINSQFNYNYENGNLTSVTKPDGTIENYNYSSIIDTRYKLDELSYGKKVLRLICSETYCYGIAHSLRYNKNLTSQMASEALFEVLPNNFYNKKSIFQDLSNPSGQTITEEEFFFN